MQSVLDGSIVLTINRLRFARQIISFRSCFCLFDNTALMYVRVNIFLFCEMELHLVNQVPGASQVWST